MYQYKRELNALVLYVQKNIKEDEMLYVYQNSITMFKYKNGYDTDKIGNVKKNNIIWGKEKNNTQWNGISKNYPDLENILEYKKVYLLFTNHWSGIDFGLNYLEQYGTIKKILEVYDTPLYYFEKGE